MRTTTALMAMAALVLAACSATDSAAPSASAPPAASPPSAGVAVDSEPLRLVTLGDSYTAGTGTLVPRRESWPQQLVRAMRNGVRLRLVANLADVAKDSKAVIDEQLRQLDSLRPDVVSLLIGANDIIAPDITLEMYRRNVAQILDELLEQLPADRIFVITTPDYTLTARGGDYGRREAASQAVAEANAMLREESEQRGITVIDISPVSERVQLDATLVAADGLHPSAKQYAGWVEIIAPTMESVLLGRQP